MAMDGRYPRNIRTSCPHPAGQLKLFKFVPDKFVQENNAEGMAMDVRYVAGAWMRRSDDLQRNYNVVSDHRSDTGAPKNS